MREVRRIFHAFQAGWESRDAGITYAYIQLERLRLVAESCHQDLKRLTSYHGIVADHHKDAGFLTRWLLHFKPIAILDPISRNEPRDAIKNSRLVHLVNERLALQCAFEILGGANADFHPANLGRQEFDALEYTATYRRLAGEDWGVLLHFVEQRGSSAP
jgi:hypothetical protein